MEIVSQLSLKNNSYPFLFSASMLLGENLVRFDGGDDSRVKNCVVSFCNF